MCVPMVFKAWDDIVIHGQMRYVCLIDAAVRKDTYTCACVCAHTHTHTHTHKRTYTHTHTHTRALVMRAPARR